MTGFENTALGFQALYSNATGQDNTALGTLALYSNTSANSNTAVGAGALNVNTSGGNNVAVGFTALATNRTGTQNTAVGNSALENANAGTMNIALGAGAGFNIGAGSNDIDIGNEAPNDESNTIRIGNSGHASADLTYIYGIYGGGVNGNGVNVMVDDSGKLGVGFSSARFKKDIHNMGASTNGLMKLRPVRFRYKNDPSGLDQYGLVAEEVAKIYPGLVMYDTAGRPLTVRYQFVNAMLLNEVQKQARQIAAQKTQIAQLSEQTRQISVLTARLTQIEAVLGAQGHVAPVEASYKTGREL